MALGRIFWHQDRSQVGRGSSAALRQTRQHGMIVRRLCTPTVKTDSLAHFAIRGRVVFGAKCARPLSANARPGKRGRQRFASSGHCLFRYTSVFLVSRRFVLVTSFSLAPLSHFHYLFAGCKEKQDWESETPILQFAKIGGGG